MNTILKKNDLTFCYAIAVLDVAYPDTLSKNFFDLQKKKVPLKSGTVRISNLML